MHPDLQRQPVPARRYTKIKRGHYKYLPLNADKAEIRVLEVLPGGSNEPVRCRVQHISLTDEIRPRYEAISYCWQTIPGKATVYLDRRPVSTTASSAAALTRLRSSRKSRLLWIDGLCIDQRNLAGRSQQVALMGKVYSSSEQTAVWLGDSDVDPKDLYSALAVLHNELCSAMNAISGSAGKDLKRWVQLDDAARSYRLQPQIHVDYNTLGALLSVDWFTRLWVVQEIALARSSTCYYGRCELSLHYVLETIEWLTRNTLRIDVKHPENLHGSNVADRVLEGMCNAFGLRELSAGWPSDYHLNRILRLGSTLEMTDPRDSIYALLGIFDRYFSRIGFDGSPLPAPDYTKDLRDVLTDATFHFITQWNMVGILEENFALPAEREEYAHFPSWVPLVQILGWHRGVVSPRGFRAAGRREAVLTLDDEAVRGDWLKLLGIAADDIYRVVAIPQGLSISEGYSVLVETAMSLLRECRPGFSSDACLRQVAMTLVRGEMYDDIHYGRLDESDVCSHFVAFRKYVAFHGEVPVADEPLGNISGHMRRFLSESEESVMAFRYQQAIDEVSERCRFFVAAAGHLGLGPSHIQEGDLVTILFGFRTPSILRPCNQA